MLQYNAFVALLMTVKQAIGQTNLIRHENTSFQPTIDVHIWLFENQSQSLLITIQTLYLYKTYTIIVTLAFLFSI